jgi:processive 1,2-diacylglycerol beta-glucosyltransferase
LVERVNLGKFLRFLQEGSWDVIVNTHFLPAELIAGLRSKARLNTPHVTVTTDFETHRLWVNQPCDHYFTATEEGAINLAQWGVPGADITVTGIPIHPAFSKCRDQRECRDQHGLTGDRPVILQLAGGFGVGPIEGLFDAVLAVEIPLELVVVTGRNEVLQQRLQKRTPPSRHRVHVLGFTTQMDELMTAADLVMTKPGGLTTSEALACGAALVVVNPIPGQESRNSDFLLENAAAIKINNVGTLPYKLTQLLRAPERIAQLRQNARKLGKPDAAFRVARTVLGWPAPPPEARGKIKR